MASLRFSVRFVFGALLIAGMGLGMLACGSDQATEEVTVIKPRLVKTPSGQRAFTGTLVNQRSSALSIVQIEVALYDDTGSPVETVRIDVKDVPAQDSVDFSSRIDSDRAFSQAQVQSILTP